MVAVVIDAAIELAEYGVAVRSHNLNIIYKSSTCDDLPLKGDTNVAACEQAISIIQASVRWHMAMCVASCVTAVPTAVTVIH